MDHDEAKALLRHHLEAYRRRPYAELVRLIGQPQISELNGAAGVKYQVEVEIFWDARPGGDVRVLGSIDDAGWRSLQPLCDDFILAANGKFVGQ